MISSGPFRPAADLSSLYKLGDEWLVPGIIPKAGLAILASSPKTGKTCFATALARAVVKGESFLGRPTIQSPVLWCAYEETPQERLPLHTDLTNDDPFLIAYPGDLPPLPTKIGKPDRFGRRDMRDLEPPFLFEHAAEVGAKLIVIDCLHAGVEGANLADNSTARAVVGTLRTWGFHMGVSVLLLHHLTKSSSRGSQPERFADSAQILAAASCYFFMDRVDIEPEEKDCAGSSRVTLFGKGRYPTPAAKLSLLSSGPLDYRLLSGHGPTTSAKISASDRVLQLLEDGWCLTASEMGRRLGLNPATVRSAVARLHEDRKICISDRVRQAPKYALANGTANENTP